MSTDLITRDEVELKLQQLSGLNVRELTGDEAVAVTVDGEVTLGHHQLTSPAVVSLLSCVGVPTRLVKSVLRAETAAAVLTEAYRYRRVALNLLLNGQTAVAFVPRDRYHAVDSLEVLNVVDTALGGLGVDYARVAVAKNFDVHLEVVGAEQHEVEVGDLVRGGARVRFNPVGLTNMHVQAYGSRLTCLNGATSNLMLAEYDGSQVESWEAWLAESTAAAYATGSAVVDQWRVLAGTEVSPQEQTLLLGGLAKRAKLSKEANAALWARATESSVETLYDVLNCFTWVTSHVVTDAQRLEAAQAAAAQFVEEEVHLQHCPTCDRVV